jgi:integrase
MKLKLTDQAVARLKPPASGKVDVWDQALPAFGIQLRATGRRAWIIQARRPGKATASRIKIGDPATMPLAEARERARELMRDPSALAEPAEEPASPELGEVTGNSPMSAVVAAFIRRDQQPKNRSWREVQRTLRHDLGDWAGRPLRSIAQADVVAMVDRAVDRGAPIMANRLLVHLKRLFKWALGRGLITASPAAHVEPPSPKAERERVLSDLELQAVWQGCDRLGWPFGPLVQLLMLTSQREGEVAAMRWSDLDLDRGTWTLAGSQTKAGRAHLVPLSSAAVGILRAQPRLSDLVFPGRRTEGARPVSGFSKAKARLDRASGVTGWVLHDLRRTAATALAQLRVPPHVVEKVLNHAAAGVAGPMGKIYQRYDYLAERREALELWAETLARIVATGSRGEVVQFRAG